MSEEPTKNLLPRLGGRREYFDYLDRWTVGTVDDLRAHMTTRALVKGYLLETSRTNGSRDAVAALAVSQQEVDQVDDALFRLRWPGEASEWALVEIEDQRYPVLYTAVESKIANWRVDRLLEGSPLLDRAWFAAPIFQRLWQLVLDVYPRHRFSQIVFAHESVFEDVTGDADLAPADPAADEEVSLREEPFEVERRMARMTVAERIGKLARALVQMRPWYEPLESIVSLRVPAPRRGGHDISFDGRFTNRSDSVAAFRQTVQTVATMYRRATEAAEERAWPETRREVGGGVAVSLGAPLLIQFSAELELGTFDRWIASLRRKNNRFRLWGAPIDLGPGKVHLYAVDNHLWQPIDLEITRKHLYALLSAGTCGNTIHRLVTNVQRFVDPKLRTYIGDEPYESFIPLVGGRTREKDA